MSLRIASSLAAACVAASGACAQGLTQPANTDRPVVSDAGRLSIRPTLTPEVAPASIDAARLANPYSATDPAQRRELNLRLWVGSGRTAFGVGTGTSATAALDDPAAAAAARPASLLLGMQRDLGDRTQVTVEHASYAATALDPARSNVRMGIEFSPVKPLNRLGLSKDSLFRVQLRGTWDLSMRPRRGGVALAIRAEL